MKKLDKNYLADDVAALLERSDTADTTRVSVIIRFENLEFCQAFAAAIDQEAGTKTPRVLKSVCAVAVNLRSEFVRNISLRGAALGVAKKGIELDRPVQAFNA